MENLQYRQQSAEGLLHVVTVLEAALGNRQSENCCRCIPAEYPARDVGFRPFTTIEEGVARFDIVTIQNLSPVGAHDPTNHPLIMCGGAGMRLWPASREVRPKQFRPLYGKRSTFSGHSDARFGCRAIMAGTPIKLFNHGKMQRDFTYVDD